METNRNQPIFLTEWMKSRRTFTPWFLGAGSMLVPVVCFLIYVNKWSIFTPEAGANGWTAYLQMNLNLATALLLPVWIILLVALNIHPEQKGNTWKRLFVTPVGKGRLFIGKLVYLGVEVVVTLIGFFITIGLTGIIAHALHPSLALPVKDLPLFNMLLTAVGLTICLLPMMTIQYVFSMLTNNVLVPASIGLFVVIVSMVLIQGWKYTVYDPYAFPLLYAWNDCGKTTLPHWLGISSVEWMSVAVCILVAWGGWWKFKRISIK